MLRYQSRRHQRLMDESEQALHDAAPGNAARLSRIAQRTLEDPKTHRNWESVHADLVRPVAEQSKRTKQVLELFDLYGCIVRVNDTAMADALKPLMSEQRDKVVEIRKRIISTSPNRWLCKLRSSGAFGAKRPVFRSELYESLSNL